MRTRFILRVHIVFGFVVLFALILMGRLYLVQVHSGEVYASMAERQYVTSNQSLYNRGTIFFEDKDGRQIAAATVKSGFMVAVTPKQLTDPGRVYDTIAPYSKFDRETFLERATRVDDPYEEVAHEVEPEVAHDLEKADLSGVNLYRERWRFYPGERLAAQALGFVAYADDGTTRSGRYGLERYYEDVLERESKEVYVNFFAELFSNVSDSLFSEGKEEAGDIVTTIEPSVQLQLEQIIASTSARWNAKRTGAIIINPQTGAVYAMGIDPSFDVNDFESVDDSTLYKNPLVENVYEMGSIIKPITMAIGLDSGVVTPQSTYVDEGSITLDGYTIRNYDGVGRGLVPMQEVLNQSLNTGVSHIVNLTGPEVFRDYMRAFGIREETGIDLPNEASGLTHNLDSPRAVEYATASFGQGIALTPIATVRALSALGNGGKLINPHLVKEIVYESGDSKEIKFPTESQVISPETSEAISRMLVEVVDDALKGGTVAKEHYSIAAKTGTAQIAKVGERGYYDDRYLHTFFGYFPAYDPEFLVFLYTIEPQGARYASETLTDPFFEITDFLINYYQVPPDR